MSTNLSPSDPSETESFGESNPEYLSFSVGGQWFGIRVLEVQDVLACRNVAPIPLSSPEIAGSINLRGRIVTVIDMRVKLGIEPAPEDMQQMNVVIDYHDEAYSLLVDEVGDVLPLKESDYEPTPVTLDQHLRELTDGLFRLENTLLLVFDVEQLIGLKEQQAA